MFKWLKWIWNGRLEAMQVKYELASMTYTCNQARRETEILLKLLDKKFLVEFNPSSFEFSEVDKRDYECLGALEYNNGSLWVKKQVTNIGAKCKTKNG